MSDVKPIPPRDSGAHGFVEKYEPLRLDGYRADFSRDIRVHPPVLHVVISKEASREILSWFQAETVETARAEAEQQIKALAGRLDNSVAQTGT